MNDLRVNNYAAFAGVTIPHQRLHITGAKLQHFFHSHNSSTTFFSPPHSLRFHSFTNIHSHNLHNLFVYRHCTLRFNIQRALNYRLPIIIISRRNIQHRAHRILVAIHKHQPYHNLKLLQVKKF